MADKVQKIREEVERLRNLHQIKYQHLDTNDNMCLVECSMRNLCNDLLLFIDSLQEEPVSEDLEEASKEWLKPQLDKSYANYGETKMMELTHFDGYAMLDAIEFGAQWQQEKDSIPAEYLEELINNLSKQFPEVSFAKLSRIVVRVAKWQKEQFEKNRLAACDIQTEEEAEIERDFVTGIIDKEHRLPTFDDAIKYGMRLKEKEMQSTIELAEDHAMLAGMEKMKEQMMAKAIDAQCFGFQGAALFSFRLPADNYLIGSEVKVIVINKD